MQINIAFCSSDAFSQHCGVTLASVLKNSSPKDDYKIFIINKSYSDENKAKFEELKKIRDFDLEFIQIDDRPLKKIKYDKNVPIESLYRFFLFSFEQVDKLLYLDCDIVVRKDIAELFSIDIEDYCLAGVEDISSWFSKGNCKLSDLSTYVNAGILLINLKKTREFDHFDFLRNLPKDLSDKGYSDQDIINYIYQEKILPIDIKYNFIYPYKNSYIDQDYYHRLAADPNNVHYITNDKPWVPEFSPYRKEEYFKYLKLTPWYDEFMEMYSIEESTAIIRKVNDMSCRLDEISNMLNDVLNRFNRRM